jgi:hypothetical protein
MEPTSHGDLVTVTSGERQRDGIVFEVESSAKVVVAVVDRVRGPVLRTVAPDALAKRTEAGPDDPRLQLVLRRTPLANRGTGPSTSGSGAGRAGHRRAAMHRTTGK